MRSPAIPGRFTRVRVANLDGGGNPEVIFVRLNVYPGTWVVGYVGGPSSASPETPPSSGLALMRAHPNPFNPSTTIPFALAGDSTVELSIYNVNGRLVRQLMEESLPAGDHSVVWDGRDSAGLRLPSAQYFYTLTVNGSVVGTQKAVILK